MCIIHNIQICVYIFYNIYTYKMCVYMYLYIMHIHTHTYIYFPWADVSHVRLGQRWQPGLVCALCTAVHMCLHTLLGPWLPTSSQGSVMFNARWGGIKLQPHFSSLVWEEQAGGGRRAPGCGDRGRVSAGAQPVADPAQPPLAAGNKKKHRQTPAGKIVSFSSFIQNTECTKMDT